MDTNTSEFHELSVHFMILSTATFSFNINGVPWVTDDEVPPSNVEDGAFRTIKFELEIVSTDITIVLKAEHQAISYLCLKIDGQESAPVIGQMEAVTNYSWRFEYKRPDTVTTRWGGADALIDEKTAVRTIDPSSPDGQYYSIDVFFATNRQKNAKNEFGSESEVDGKLNYGVCSVNIPRNRVVGSVPRPSWWTLSFRYKLEKHMLVLKTQMLDTGEFFKKAREKTDGAEGNDVLVFIHGFNVTFEEAVLRTAQICADLSFTGVPMMFSWPSQGKVRWYAADSSTVEYSVPFMVKFLQDIKRQTGARNIHIIAHSMGNRALVKALIELQHAAFYDDFKFNQIILAAPDIDAREFVYNISPKIKSCSQRLTLYASSKDKALRLSKHLHRNSRAGDSSDEIICVAGIDTVDASDVNTNLLAHDYYSSTYTLINDIYYLIKHGFAPGERNLLEQHWRNHLNYWKFKKS